MELIVILIALFIGSLVGFALGYALGFDKGVRTVLMGIRELARTKKGKG